MQTKNLSYIFHSVAEQVRKNLYYLK
jgi:hypothetical protein